MENIDFEAAPNLLRVEPGVIPDGIRALWAAPENVEFHKHEGYVVLEGKKPDKTQPDKQTQNTDGSIRTREMVLMGISEERAKKMEARIEDITRQQSNQITERMEESKSRVFSAAKRSGMSQREAERFVDQYTIDISERRG